MLMTVFENKNAVRR